MKVDLCFVCFLLVGVQFDGTFEDYATADDALLTTQPLTDEDIIQTVTEKYADKDDDDEDDDDESETQPAPTIPAALNSCTLLKDFIQTYPETQDLYKHIHALESFITRKQFASRQQTSIRDFFFR